MTGKWIRHPLWRVVPDGALWLVVRGDVVMASIPRTRRPSNRAAAEKLMRERAVAEREQTRRARC